MLVSAMMTREVMFISTIIFYSLPYNAINFIDDDNFVNAPNIKIIISLIDTVRKLSIELQC